MKFLKVVLLAGVCLPAMASHAFADPVTIGSFVITAFLNAGIGAALPVVSAAAIGNFVIGAAVVGASLLSSAFARSPKINPGDFKSTFETGDSAEIRAVGRVRVGGLKAFGNTASGTNRYRLICHVRGPVSAVEEHYFGGREITVEGTGEVSSPPWAYPGGSFAYVKSKVGDGTETAWSDLTAAFPSLWTSAHRVRGIAQSLLKFVSPGLTSEKFMKLYQSGVPDYERVQRSEPIYDPRETQDASDKSTWEYSDNGPLCAAHILRSYPSLAVADFDYDAIGDEADLADVVVDTKAGTEKRSRCWGMWNSETPRGDVMDQVLKSIGAEILPTDDNKFVVRLIDDVRVPEITFTDRHLIDLQWRAGPESVERPNICRVKYYSPERNYDMTEIDLTDIAWARNQDEIDRVGEQYMDIDLPFCPSASQAQRIARRLFALARADAGVATFNFAGLAAWGKSIAAIPLPELDITETCAIGSPRVNDEAGTVEIPFVVWPTLDAWDPDTMEADAPPVIPDLQYESDLDTPDAPSEAVLVQYPGGGAYEVRIKFNTVTGGTVVEAVYRTYTGGEPEAYSSMTEYFVEAGLARYAWATDNLTGKKVDFKVRAFNADDEGSYFSDVLSVASMAINNTTPAAPTVVATPTGSPTNGVDLVISTAQLRVVKFLAEYNYDGSGWTTMATHNDVRPGVDKTASITGLTNSDVSDKTADWRVSAFTSDGTQSAYATGSVTIPGNPP